MGEADRVSHQDSDSTLGFKYLIWSLKVKGGLFLICSKAAGMSHHKKQRDFPVLFRGDLTFADQIFADGRYPTSYYKSNLASEDGPVGP